MTTTIHKIPRSFAAKYGVEIIGGDALQGMQITEHIDRDTSGKQVGFGLAMEFPDGAEPEPNPPEAFWFQIYEQWLRDTGAKEEQDPSRNFHGIPATWLARHGVTVTGKAVDFVTIMEVTHVIEDPETKLCRLVALAQGLDPEVVLESAVRLIDVVMRWRLEAGLPVLPERFRPEASA